MIYADNAATTSTSEIALKAMMPYFSEIYANPSSLHSAGQCAAEALLDARERIAACLGASPKEIYFTSGGSESDNQALISAAKIGERRGKKHIISTAFEHHAVLHTLEKLKKQGFEVTLLPVGTLGTVLDIFVALIICVYILNSKELFAAQTRKLILATFKQERAEKFFELGRLSNQTFGGFINGKIIDSAIIGILCFLELTGSQFLTNHN